MPFGMLIRGVARRFMAITQSFGDQALAGFSSAKCSNEDHSLFQKLSRAVFGTNNVDHGIRLCHA
jgi:formate dehydrogenase major subunit